MLVSVVMSVYNGERYLHQSIKSILKQSYKYIEFIIVNDGSLDKTKEILDAYSDPRLRVIHLEENKGVSYARNTGIEASNGEWIAVQDADDISHPMRIRTQVKHILRNPDCIAVVSHIKCISESFEMVYLNHVKGIENFHNSILSSNDLYNQRFKSCPINHGSAIFSKDVFKKLGGYNEEYKLLHDYDLWLKMFEVGRIDIIHKALYYYRVHSSSITQKKWKVTIDEMMLISTIYFSENVNETTRKNTNFFSNRLNRGM